MKLSSEDHFGDRQRRIDHHDAQQVGHDVPEHDRQRLDARGHRRFDEFAVLERQRLPAHDARHAQPRDQPDADEQHDERAAEDDQHRIRMNMKGIE